ncbi:hypothetical protein DFP78_102535 [Photobacterium lutimaris]|nr:hypothetical protein DFP78_102535 [Photobacterium lutimaris]
MGYGLWAMGYGLWAMGYGLRKMCVIHRYHHSPEDLAKKKPTESQWAKTLYTQLGV